jgi:hypothetical protein
MGHVNLMSGRRQRDIQDKNSHAKNTILGRDSLILSFQGKDMYTNKI